MLLNDLDLGSAHPFAGPDSGVTVASIVVEGSNTITFGRAGKPTAHNVKLWVKAWQGIGGQAAGSINAMRYVLRQAQELAANRNMGPVYIRWTSSADPAAVLNAADLADGWYWITAFRPDYTKVPSGLVTVQMQVVEVLDGGAEKRVGMSYFPATPGLSTNYSGAAQLAVGYPLNSLGLAATSITRTGGEGAIPLSIAPVANLDPLPFGLSATVGDWFKGGVKVYDTINTASNPVPTTGGTFVNANWVQVYDRSHRFEGDCVVTNGLLLLLFQAGQARVARTYLWNTALAASNWQQGADLNYNDNAGNTGTLRGVAIEGAGNEAARVRSTMSTAGGNEAELLLRLERGMCVSRVDFRSLSQATTTNSNLTLSFPVSNPLVYTSAQIADFALSAEQLLTTASPTDYGYGAAFIRNSADPYITGWLWQNQPTTQIYGNATSYGHGDSAGPAQNATRSYGFFAIPYGVNASYSTANLQAEAESGTLQAGWSSVVDALASAGNAAKYASGGGSGQSATFGTAFVPAAGTYDVWFRVKVTSAAGSSAEMTLGLWDATASAFVSSQTYKANQASTSYVWLRVATAVTPTASHNVQFRATSAAVVGTDWFVDEAALVPKSLTTAYTGPQDLWQEFIADRTTRIVRL